MEGIKYFIYHVSRFKINNNIPYLPLEIRIIIWNKCFPYPYIQCKICNQILITLELNQQLNNKKDKYKIYNGYGDCLQH